ncbi:Uncharacterized protein FKW44_023341, partial [Caligus rogercresseyi]
GRSNEAPSELMVRDVDLGPDPSTDAQSPPGRNPASQRAKVRTSLSRLLGVPSMSDSFQDITNKLTNLKFDSADYVCLKFVLLLNP